MGRRRGPLVRGVLEVYRALVAYGACWVALPDDQMKLILSGEHGGLGDRSDGSRRPCRVAGPPPGHPERLRDDIPLTALELRLSRELNLR
ncbi:DUF6059 family protein [Streptomyces sp. NPDC048751]|uniref:DUF6059 family protein n=1 Tax=Streptomyces sp. NPDC048751 TaxID=3365591 RepID=UPI00371C7620